jgi:hypothetical protein
MVSSPRFRALWTVVGNPYPNPTLSHGTKVLPESRTIDKEQYRGDQLERWEQAKS